jgi:hypothetical protein
MIFHAFCPLRDYLLRCNALWHLSRTRLFPCSWGFGYCGEEVMKIHSCGSEFGRKFREGEMENMLRRGECSWSCVKFEIGFIAGQGSLIRVLSSSFLSLTVNELCLRFWPHPYAA